MDASAVDAAQERERFVTGLAVADLYVQMGRRVQQITALRRAVKDPQAFETFYREHAQPVLVFFARRTLDSHIALELTAETFAQAFRRRGQFRGHTDEEAAGWLFSIARSQYARYLRNGQVERRALERLQIQLPEYSESDLHRIEELAELDGLRSAVATRFADLPDRQRRALQLRIVDELTYPEVAERLGVTEDTARARVSRGLRMLRSVLPATKETLA